MRKILAVVSIQDISILMRLLCKELKLCATAGRKAACMCCGRRLAEKIWMFFPSCFFLPLSLSFLMSSVWEVGEQTGTLSLNRNWWGRSHTVSLLLPLTIRLLILLGYIKLRDVLKSTVCSLREQPVQRTERLSCITLLSLYFHVQW